MTLKCKIKEMSVSIANSNPHASEPSIDEFIITDSQKTRAKYEHHGNVNQEIENDLQDFDKDDLEIVGEKSSEEDD